MLLALICFWLLRRICRGGSWGIVGGSGENPPRPCERDAHEESLTGFVAGGEVLDFLAMDECAFTGAIDGDCSAGTGPVEGK